MENTLKDQLEGVVTDNTTETADAPQTNDEESTLGVDESKKPDTSVDEYEALLAEERAKRERAEKKILKLKSEAKTPAIDMDALKEELREVARQEMLAVREDDVKETLETALTSLATTPSERELIAHHYTNTIQKSGTSQGAIMQDLQRAKLIANEAKILKQNEELRGALKSRATLTTAPEFSGGGNRGEEAVQMTPFEKALIRGLGQEEYVIKRLKQK